MRNTIKKVVSNVQYYEALIFYSHTHAASIQPNNFTFPFLFKACGKLQFIPQTQQLHTQILKSGFQSHNHTVTALTDAYMKFCLFEDALKLFDEIPNPTLPSFNVVISGFSRSGYLQDSILILKRLESKGIHPNSVTIASILPVCQTTKLGSQLHSLAMKDGHDVDQYVATALVTMYSNCGELGSAVEIFRVIQMKTVVNYNAMISGFMRNRSFANALDLFREMIIHSREKPSSSSFLSLLSVCVELSAVLLGKEMHCYSLKSEAISNVMIGTALIDMYSKCGSVDLAFRVFMTTSNRNLVTWNSMMSGLLSNGHVVDAVELFHKLRLEGLEADTVTWNLMISGLSKQGNEVEALKFFARMQLEGVGHSSLKSMTSLLQACSSISDLQHGKQIHSNAIRNLTIFEDEFIQTALVDMYMKCGCSRHARTIFERIERKSEDPALWNAMISGYGTNGENESALEILREMQERGLKPNSATFIGALSVCSHTGQIDKGRELFQTMSQQYGINPTAKHIGSMVDLLGRAGKLDEAWDLIERTPEPSVSLYSSLLGACECHSHAELGEATAERFWELEPWNATPLVILSNIYAKKGRTHDMEWLRKMMTDRGLFKVPGCSWIGVKKLCSKD